MQKKRLEIATEMDVKAQLEMPCFLRPDQFRGVSHLVLGKPSRVARIAARM